MQSENQHCGSLPSLSSIVQFQTSKQTDHCLDSYEYSSEDSSCNSEARTCVSLNNSSFIFAPNKSAEIIPYNKLYGNYEQNLNEIESDDFYSQLKNTSSCNDNNVNIYDEDIMSYDKKDVTQTTKRLSASTPNLSNEKLSEYRNFKMLFLKGNTKNSLYVQRIMELNDGANYEYLLMSSVPENLNLCLVNSEDCDKMTNSNNYVYFNDKSNYDLCYDYNSTNNKSSNKNNWNKKTASYANLTKLNYSDESINKNNINVEIGSIYFKSNIETDNDNYDGSFSSNCIEINENPIQSNQLNNNEIHKPSLNRISEEKETFLVIENKLPEANCIYEKTLHPIQRLVSSTPDLFQCQVNDEVNEAFPTLKIANNQIYQSLIKLAFHQSSETPKNGFSNKGVSFHPIVSEIIWKENQKKDNENQNLSINKSVKTLLASSNIKTLDIIESMNNFEDIPKNVYNQFSFKTDTGAKPNEKIELFHNYEGSFHSYINPQNISKTSNEYKKKGFLSRLSSGFRFSLRKKLSKKNKKNGKQTIDPENNENLRNHNNACIKNYECNSSTFESQNITDDISKKEHPKNKVQQNINKHDTLNLLGGDLVIESMSSQKFASHKNNDIDLKHQQHKKNCNIVTNGNILPGLIETNLDTDETLINGKTRSLIDLGVAGGCSIINNKSKNTNNNNQKNKRIRGRRPHKSMEFLLDKENHRCAMVS
jgi:ribosomal protein L31